MPPKKKKVIKKKVAPADAGDQEPKPNASAEGQPFDPANADLGNPEFSAGLPAPIDRNGHSNDDGVPVGTERSLETQYNPIVNSDYLMQLLGHKNDRQIALAAFFRWKEFLLFQKSKQDEEKERFKLFCSAHESLKQKTDAEIEMVLVKYAGRPEDMWMDIYKLYGTRTTEAANTNGYVATSEEGIEKEEGMGQSEDPSMHAKKVTSRKIISSIDALKEQEKELENEHDRILSERQDVKDDAMLQEIEEQAREFAAREKKLKKSKQKIVLDILKDLDVPTDLPNRRALVRQLDFLKAQMKEKEAKEAIVKASEISLEQRYNELAKSTTAAVSQIEVLTRTNQAQKDRLNQLESTLLSVDRREQERIAVLERHHTEALKASTRMQVELVEENEALKRKIADLERASVGGPVNSNKDLTQSGETANALQKQLAERERELNMFQKANGELKQKLDDALKKIARIEEVKTLQANKSVNEGKAQQQPRNLSEYEQSLLLSPNAIQAEQWKQSRTSRAPPGWNPWDDQRDPISIGRDRAQDSERYPMNETRHQRNVQHMEPWQNIASEDASRPSNNRYSLADRSSAHYQASDPLLLTRTGNFLSQIDDARNLEKTYFAHMQKQRAPLMSSTSDSMATSSSSSFLRRRGDDISTILNSTSQFYSRSKTPRSLQRPAEPKYDGSKQYFPMNLHHMKI